MKGFEGRVEVEGREHVVKVIGGGAEFDEGGDGRKLLRLKIKAAGRQTPGGSQH